VALFAIDPNNEERLLHVSYLEVVGLEEVLGNAHLLAIMRLEAEGNWVLLELDGDNLVGLLVAIAPNDCLIDKLITDAGFLILELRGAVDLMDALEAGLGGDELIDAVED